MPIQIGAVRRSSDAATMTLSTRRGPASPAVTVMHRVGVTGPGPVAVHRRDSGADAAPVGARHRSRFQGRWFQTAQKMRINMYVIDVTSPKMASTPRVRPRRCNFSSTMI